MNSIKWLSLWSLLRVDFIFHISWLYSVFLCLNPILNFLYVSYYGISVGQSKSCSFIWAYLTWWRLFQKLVVRTKFDIYIVFIKSKLTSASEFNFRIIHTVFLIWLFSELFPTIHYFVIEANLMSSDVWKANCNISIF